jgi:hypothetical protein
VGKGEEGNPWGWIRWGEDADWGVMTAALVPKPFYWVLRKLFSPVWIKQQRVTWRPGERHVTLDVTNHYNAIDLRDCTFRTMMAGGGKWMGQMRNYRDVPVRCRPGRTVKVKVPVWNKASLGALEQGLPVCLRCIFLDPAGFRPITTDVLILPARQGEDRAAMPIGPDAVLE